MQHSIPQVCHPVKDLFWQLLFFLQREAWLGCESFFIDGWTLWKQRYKPSQGVFPLWIRNRQWLPSFFQVFKNRSSFGRIIFFVYLKDSMWARILTFFQVSIKNTLTFKILAHEKLRIFVYKINLFRSFQLTLTLMSFSWQRPFWR